MMRLSKLILALGAALALAASAHAQSGCGGQFGAGKFCGNAGASTGLPGPVALTPGVLAPIAGGTVIGNPTGATAAPTATTAPVLGIPGTSTGQLGIAGIGGGTATLSAQSAAGSATVLLPTTSGTLASSAAAPIILDPMTGILTCPTCVTSSGGGAITGVAPINVSAAGVVSLSTPLAVQYGGTGLSAGTSGGVPYFDSTSTMASSGALGANQIVLGGGAGGAPTALGSTGTATTVLHGNAAGAPTFGAVSLTADVSGILPLANGGTNASLTASNGGIFWSNATQAQILAGTSTAGQMLRSGASATPSWSTATWPATTTANQLLYSSAANTVAGLPSANGGVLNTSGAGVPSVTPTPTLGVNGGTGGSITLNGSTSGSVVVQAAAAAGTGTIFQLPATNGTNGYALTTNGSGVTAWSPAGTGTVTSVAAGTGMSFSTITTSGSVAIDKATTSNIWAATSNKTLTADTVFNAAGALVNLSGTTTVPPDFSTGFNFAFTATSATNYTLANPTNAKPGQTGCIYLNQPSSGTVVTITFGTNWYTAGGVSGKSLTPVLGAIDRVCYFVISSSQIDFTLANNIAH